MKIEPRTLKGFRDFLPTEAKKRQYVIETLKRVFESYGFEPLETPALEYEDILLGKYGDEGDKLMYRFSDNGNRRVALRYDQTVPLARIIAQYKNALPSPFKRYQIANVWRAENTQKGRFREFLQCDIDIVGKTSLMADVEILKIVGNCMNALGFENYKILVNDRRIFEGIDGQAISIIDKLKKIGVDGVREELKKMGFDENILEEIQQKKPTQLIQNILSNQSEIGVEPLRVVFDPTLSRGLDYYTGLIIEVEIEGFDAGSVGGGGRYDNLIGIFSQEPVPAVGFAFGFDRLMEGMEQQNLFPSDTATTKFLVTLPSLDLIPTSMEISSKIRALNINTEVYLDENDKMEKQLKYAQKNQIPYVIIPLDTLNIELRKKSESGEIVKEQMAFEKLIEKLQTK